MKFQHRFLLLTILYFLGLAIVLLFSLYGWGRTREIQESIILGQKLQIKSREVQSLMKDIVFDLFAPRIYGQIRSLTYSPRSVVTLRQWSEGILEYEVLFNKFMELDFLRRTRDEFIRDQYLITITMNNRAMAMLSKMEGTLTILRKQYRTEENLYNTMQKEDSLIPFFNEFRETSFYFTNNFEGYMNYFIKSLQEEDRRVQQVLIAVFIALSVFIMALYSFFIIILINGLRVRVFQMEETFQRVSHGDFSHRMPVNTRDEFGLLSERLNDLIDDLKENVDSILNLTRDVANRIPAEGDVEDLLKLIVQTVVQDTGSETAIVFATSESDGVKAHKWAGMNIAPPHLKKLEEFLSRRVLRSGTHFFIKDSREYPELEGFSSLIAVSLITEGRVFGLLVSLKVSTNEFFSDLGVTRFVTFGEYASLTIDSFFKYKELMTRREARYHALQAQLKPHFLYNVLGSLIGLNRMGDKNVLERAIFALKDMLRYIQDPHPFATLEEELTLIEKYLMLQQIRFGQRLNFRVSLDNEAKYVLVPRLVLQPFVENSVLHGIEPLEYPGFIEITASGTRHKGGRGAMIQIKDNGIGFEKESVKGGENIGLDSSRQRLRIAFPEGKLQISSAIGQGTTVSIEI